jgi:hypothetical protein
MSHPAMAGPTSARAAAVDFFSCRAEAFFAAADPVVSVVLLMGFGIKSKITIMIKNQAGAMAPPDLNLNLSLHLDRFFGCGRWCGLNKKPTTIIGRGFLLKFGYIQQAPTASLTTTTTSVTTCRTFFNITELT